MSKHTPGPWEVTGDGDIIESKKCQVGEVYFYSYEDGEIIDIPYQANARLMAAAPEMKAKLDEMAEFLRIVYACIPEEIAGTCARQITNWEILKAKIEGDE